MTIIPHQLAFYKGMGGKWGAIQFNYNRPHYYIKNEPRLKNYEGRFIIDEWHKLNKGLTKDSLSYRDGVLFVEIASTTDKNVYDWSNKIVMALSTQDMGKILTLLEGTITEEVKIMHDPGAKSSSEGNTQKYLTVTSPKGIKKGAMISVSQRNSDGNKITHTVPLSCDEVKVLAVCIRKVIPATLGW